MKVRKTKSTNEVLQTPAVPPVNGATAPKRSKRRKPSPGERNPKSHLLEAPAGLPVSMEETEKAGRAVDAPSDTILAQGLYPDERVPGAAAQPPTPVTQVVAKTDVGFGNTLFIRGEGGGLTWAKGQPLTCIEADRWVWATPQAQAKVSFKLLLNDTFWAQGEDAVVDPGQSLELVPRFNTM